jgi:hypothetical protein
MGPFELHFLLSVSNYSACLRYNTLLLEQEIQCMSHASMEIHVVPILIYNTSGFTRYISIVHANLNNILRPNFNQVSLDYLCNVSCILCVPRNINSPQELFANRRDTHHI